MPLGSPLTNASSSITLATCQLALGDAQCLGLGLSRLCASCMHHSWDYSVETVLNPQTAVHTAVPARKHPILQNKIWGMSVPTAGKDTKSEPGVPL